LYRQLDELALRPESGALRWTQKNGSLFLELHAGEHDAASEVAVDLEQGVRELVWPSEHGIGKNGQSFICWSTAGLVFDSSHGWDRDRAEQWLWEHAHLRDLGRTATLDAQWRSHRKIAAFCSAVLGETVERPALGTAPLAVGEPANGGTTKNTDATPLGEHIEFVRVSAPEEAPRRTGTPDRKSGASHKAGPAAPGKAELGLEADLSDSHQRQRLPLELQMKLPLRGIVNLAEAAAIIRCLEQLAIDAPAGRQIAVLSWQPHQVQLLEHLWAKSAAAARRENVVAFATVSQFRGREADIVLASLCRSAGPTGIAAVKFAEDADDWRTLLSCARNQLRLFGDPITLSHYSQKVATGWERSLIAKLMTFFPSAPGPQARTSSVRAGVPA
jgi:hypothetical protein